MALDWRSLCFACCLVLLAAHAGEADNKPFKSLKAPAETIRNYEVIQPEVVYRSDAEQYPRKLAVTLQSFTLHLVLNEILIPPHFTNRYYDENGNEIVEKGHVNCFYQGSVEGYPDWTATLSTCHGLQGSFGNHADRDQYFHIEPLSELDTSLEQPHALYLSTELPQRQGTCGSAGHVRNSDAILSHKPALTLEDADMSKRLRRQSRNGILVVEWALVNDNRQYIAYNRNLTAVVLRDIEIANYVSGLYSGLRVNIPGVLGVRISLVSVTTWTSGDQIDVVSNPDTLLDRFEEYVPRIGDPNDSAMLITGVNLDGNTVGIAFIRTMCSDTASVGLSQDGARSLESIGSTAAHELGHIFNMNHDDGRGCTCSDVSDECIMSAVSSFPQPVAWSSCSEDDITSGFTNFNLDRCLQNTPAVTVGDPICGNGIREQDEVCDCGSIQECQDPCCNSTSCQLVEGAECSQGACCTERCQFRGYGETCREASSGGCDIVEYCSGDRSDCSEDLHFQDGFRCNNGQAYCFSGSCVTYDDQCVLNYGPGSGVGVDDCFERHNVVGNQFGNCGSQNEAFTACLLENVFCGQLHCNSGSFINPNNLPVTTLRNSAFGDDNSLQTCLSFTTQPSANQDFASPGLVQDGSTCAQGMLCYMRECVPAASLSYVQPCSVGGNGLTCSGNGTCNNRNLCSCDVGFAGSACQDVFEGPGTNQGTPTSTENATTVPTIEIKTGGSNGGVVAGAVIGVILGLLLLAGATVGVIALVWYVRSRRKAYPTSSSSSSSSSSHRHHASPANKLSQSQDNLLSTATVAVKTPSSSSRSQLPPSSSSAAPAYSSAYKPPPARVPPPANIGRRPPPPPANVRSHPPPPSRGAPLQQQPVKPVSEPVRPPPPSRRPPKPVEPVPEPVKPRPPAPGSKPPPKPAGKPGKVQWPPAAAAAAGDSSNRPTPAARKPVLPPPRN